MIDPALLIVLLFIILLISGVAVWEVYFFTRRLNQQNRTIVSSRRIYQLILENLDYETVVQKIADTIPFELEFGTGVVAVLDENRGVIRRIAASKTKQAQMAIAAISNLSVPFEKIEISIHDQSNLMAKVIKDKKSYITKDLYDVLGPVLTREQTAQIQKVMGTKTTLVYPIFLKQKPIGVFLASTSKDQDHISESEFLIINDFVNLIGLVMQNSRLYTSLQSTTSELEVANVKLQELDKLKDDFVSIASHELRTPMTAIRSYSWMALNRSDIPLSPKLKKYLERTMISTERLINLVNDMLNISRIESGRIDINPKVMDVISLVKEVQGEVVVKASERGVSVVVDETKIPQIFADPDKVHQVLLNLIGNSLKFTPQGGQVRVHFFSDGKEVQIAIQDNGVGISKEDIGKLFTKFGRLDSSYVAAATSGGTGLGLFICKKLVELMKGRIGVRSDGLNKGTTFFFTLPVATSSQIEHPELYKVSAVGEAKGLEPVTI